MRYIVSVLLLSLGIAPIVVAQDEDARHSLHDIISLVALKRSSLIAFDVTVKGRIERKVQTEEKHLEDFEFRFALDIPERRLRVSRVNRFKAGDTMEQEDLLYVETPDWEIHGRGNQAIVYAPGVCLSRRPAFFDLRVVGLYFCGDFVLGSPAETIFGNYLQWENDFDYRKSDDGLIVLQQGMLDHTHAVLLKVDAERDYWPIELVRFTNSEVRVRNVSTLKKTAGMWLPSTTVIECPGETTYLDYTWHSVNSALGEELFRKDRIEKERGVEMLYDRSAPRAVVGSD